MPSEASSSTFSPSAMTNLATEVPITEGISSALPYKTAWDVIDSSSTTKPFARYNKERYSGVV